LIVLFIHKTGNIALILSARDVDNKERRRYERNDDAQLTPISKARTPEEIAEFWDSHSLADYWDETHEVAFKVRAQRSDE
jgi:hypothetical protein